MSNSPTFTTAALTDDDWPEVLTADVRAFGAQMSDTPGDAIKDALDLHRFRIARDSATGDLVGAVGAFDLELTLPGNAQVPMGGLTWVAVAPTHRRRGILGRLIGEVHDASTERGEPLMGLWASESGIYERYGYGVATSARAVEITRAGATFRNPPGPDLGTVRLGRAKDHVEDIARRWDAYRRSAPGEPSRSVASFRASFEHGSTDIHAALHDDGYALWSMDLPWGDSGLPDGTLRLVGFVASTPAAHEALWRTILSVDLVATIKAGVAMRANDPLRWLLTDPRQVRTVTLWDGLWLRVADPVTCFDARSYRVDERIVLDVASSSCGPSTRVEVTGAGARATDADADLALTASAAGSLLLGAVSASELSAGGRITEVSTGSLGRADALFGWAPEAACASMF